MSERAPSVSVITPFYNTAPYLAACIESVLAQTFADFEYILVNNHSTDGSRDIAARYAAADARVRLVDNEVFVGQVENYNGALERAHPGCEFVKLVQADDMILPDCLALMSQAARTNPRVGIVSSYYLKGAIVLGTGVQYGTNEVDGRKACRGMLLNTGFPVGSPTTVLYRATAVRARRPFYALGRYHEDTEAHCEILLEQDLAFVHQVLSFSRTDNISIMSAARRFDPELLDHLILLEKYGPLVLSPEELAERRALEWAEYRAFLAASIIRRQGEDFWSYHRKGLATIGVTLEKRDLLFPFMKQLGRLLLNPLYTLENGVSDLGRKPGH